MSLLLALLLSQTPGQQTSITARQGSSLDGGRLAWAVECNNCGGGSVSGTFNFNGYILDAGVLNVNFPATQAVSAAALPLPTGASTEATLALIKAKTDNLDVAISTRTKPADSQNVTGTVTANAGSGTMAVSAAALPLPSGASTSALQGTGNTSLGNIDGKLPALVAGKVPVDIGSVTVTVVGGLTDTQLRLTPVPISGPVTDAQLRASAVPVSLAVAPTTPVTGTFFQATQPVSLAVAPTTPVTGTFFQTTQPVAIPDGGVPASEATNAAILAAMLSGSQRVVVNMVANPINPFLPRCNPVRRTGCQP